MAEQLLISVVLQVWKLSRDAFGSFVSNVAPPLSIGNIELENGETVKGLTLFSTCWKVNFFFSVGFLCEQYVLPKSKNISEFGGWRNYTAKAKQ